MYNHGWFALLYFPGGSGAKNTPAVQETRETQVQPLGREDPLEGVATHSSMLAWEILWTEEPGGLQSKQSKRVRHNWTDWAHGRNQDYIVKIKKKKKFIYIYIYIYTHTHIYDAIPMKTFQNKSSTLLNLGTKTCSVKAFLHCTTGTHLYEICKRYTTFLKFHSLVTIWKLGRILRVSLLQHEEICYIGRKQADTEFRSTSLRQLEVHPGGAGGGVCFPWWVCKGWQPSLQTVMWS